MSSKIKFKKISDVQLENEKKKAAEKDRQKEHNKKVKRFYWIKDNEEDR